MFIDSFETAELVNTFFVEKSFWSIPAGQELLVFERCLADGKIVRLVYKRIANAGELLAVDDLLLHPDCVPFQLDHPAWKNTQVLVRNPKYKPPEVQLYERHQ